MGRCRSNIVLRYLATHVKFSFHGPVNRPMLTNSVMEESCGSSDRGKTITSYYVLIVNTVDCLLYTNYLHDNLETIETSFYNQTVKL